MESSFQCCLKCECICNIFHSLRPCYFRDQQGIYTIKWGIWFSLWEPWGSRAFTVIGSWNKWTGLKSHGFLNMNIIIKIQNNKLNVFTCNIHIWIRLPPACCVYANWSNDTFSNVNFSLSSTKIHYPAYFWYQRVNLSSDT